MTTNDFFKLSSLEMNIEVTENEAYKYSCKAQNELSLRGYSKDFRYYESKSREFISKAKRLKKQLT